MAFAVNTLYKEEMIIKFLLLNVFFEGLSSFFFKL